MKETLLDSVTLYSMDPDDRKNYFPIIRGKYEGHPEILKKFDELAAMPSEQQDTRLMGGIEMLGKAFGMDQKPGPPKQKTGSFQIANPKTGEKSLITGVFDPESGEVVPETTALPPGFEFVDKIGETGQARTKRKVEEARKKKEDEGTTKIATDLIERGVVAAESTANIRRGLELLEKVETGGIAAIGLSIRKKLGVEGADEGELSNSLGKAVLSQLRETFGAAFTENEGKRLENIEASFGKSLATNKRLLKQALKIAERTARRARKAAVDREDRFSVEDIDELLAFSLSDETGLAPDQAPAVQKQSYNYNPETGMVE
jgi:hypothetical protein